MLYNLIITLKLYPAQIKFKIINFYIMLNNEENEIYNYDDNEDYNDFIDDEHSKLIGYSHSRIFNRVIYTKLYF